VNDNIGIEPKPLKVRHSEAPERKWRHGNAKTAGLVCAGRQVA
jgi:hypothetical protein